MDEEGTYRSFEPGPLATDMDAFLGGVYRYYLEGGLTAVVMKSITNLAASIFTFLLSFSVLFLIDWSAVWMCKTDVTECAKSSLVFPSPFSKVSFFRFILFCQLIILGFFTVIIFSLSSVAKIREAIKVSKFYRLGLKIADDRELAFLDWHSDIVKRIIEYQSAAVNSPLCIVQPELSGIEITNLIMRFDNIVLAILKKVSNESFFDNLILSSVTIKFLLQFGLVSWCFDDQYRIRSDLLNGPTFTVREQISNRFKLMSLVYIVFMFPILIFGTFLLIIRESGKLRSGFSSLGDWEPSGMASVVLRHFSEMDHLFRKRMEMAVSKFSSLNASRIWKNEFSENVLKIGLFVTSGILAVLALVAVVDEKALVYLPMFMGGTNLFFYFAIFSVCFGILVRIDSKQICDEKVDDRIRLVISMMSFTHHEMDLTISNYCDSILDKAIAVESMSRSVFFEKKIFILLKELLAIVLVPFLFYFRADQRLVGATISVLQSGIHQSDKLGDFAKSGFFFANEEIEMTEMSETKIADTIDPIIALSVLSSNMCDSYEHKSLVFQISEFKQRCVEKLKNYENFNLCFWYLLYRAVRQNRIRESVFGLDDDIVRAVQDEPVASRTNSRREFYVFDET